MAAANYNACLAFTLRYEGGYVDHPRDPGGATNLGVTQRTLSAWRGWQVSKNEVRGLTRGEAAMIYRKQYWQAVSGDALPYGVDLAVFDYAVNSGPARAAKALQKALGTEPDGQIGIVTLDAMNGVDHVKIIGAICEERFAFVRRLSTFATFGKGWSARISAVKATALRMVTRAPALPDDPQPKPADPGKAREADTATVSKKGFWEKLTAAGGVLATLGGALTDWKVAAVIVAGAVVGFIVWRMFASEDIE